jgi:hypothetical protein
MLEKLFESLDEKVFTPKLKESLETEFNEAVDLKATVLAQEQIQDEIDALSEKAEEYTTMLDEKAEEYIELKKEEILESLDKYLERIVDEFVIEAGDALSESVKSDKADMIIDAFDSMLTAVGVDVAKIVEAKDDESAENKLEESTNKYDVLVEENIELKELTDTLIKMGVISEMKENLSIVEAQKFEKLAEIVEFSRSEEYKEKLETIKESVKGYDSTIKEEKDLNEGKKSSYSHLI